MSIGNRVVQGILTSPLRGVLSGSTALIRYTGRRSGAEFTTPTQFARCGDLIVIAVASPDRKTWWRNFREERPLEVLVGGTWMPMVGEVIDPADQPADAEPLLAAYLARFPRAARLFEGTDHGHALIVRCRPV